MNGKDLKKILLLNELTQENAAKLLNVSRSTLINWLNSETLSDKTLQKINKAVSVNNLQIVSNCSNIITGDNNHHIEQNIKSDKIEALISKIQELQLRINEKDAQIKEKDAQIKEKDAQIKDLHEIIKQLNRK